MEQKEEMDLYKVDIAKAALSCNANLVVVYNHKKMMVYHEALQEMTEKFPDKVLTLPLFCAMVDENGGPCKEENAGNSFAFVARDIPKDEALDEY